MHQVLQPRGVQLTGHSCDAARHYPAAHPCRVPQSGWWEGTTTARPQHQGNPKMLLAEPGSGAAKA